VFFCATLAFAFVEPFFFIGYLFSIAIFGLYQPSSWPRRRRLDNAKKIVEVELKQRAHPLHDATVIGDTVGDPFKDTSSRCAESGHQVHDSLGLLAVELAVQLTASQGTP